MKQIGFKQEVKEREGVMDEQSGESEEEEVVSRKWNWYQNKFDKEID